MLGREDECTDLESRQGINGSLIGSNPIASAGTQKILPARGASCTPDSGDEMDLVD